MASELQARYAQFQREMVEQLERTAAVESHWLMYMLLGWESLLGNVISHYLLHVEQVEASWPVTLTRIIQIFVTIFIIKLFIDRSTLEESPLEPLIKRIWFMYLFLCLNIGLLNAISGQPNFAFLPTLAVVTSFGFTALTTFVSRKFAAGGLFMFVVGVLMALYPGWAFLIWGSSWCLVLQVMGLVFLRKRRQWLPAQDVGLPKLAFLSRGSPVTSR
jgi:hypothetical protein